MVWLKRIAVVLGGLIAVIGGGGLLLPSSAHVERQIVINVPQDQVFALINSFERFNDWSPWADLDPNTRYEFAGPIASVGAKMSWASDDASVGKGSQEIIESSPPTLVRARLRFDGQADAISFHRLDAMEAGTAVTWGFDTDFGYDVIGRWIGLLMLDSMIGADFDKGLKKMKAVLEQAATPLPAPAAGESPPLPSDVPVTEPVASPAATG